MFLDITSRGEFAVQGFDTEDLGIFKELPYEIHQKILNELEISHKLEVNKHDLEFNMNEVVKYLRLQLFERPVYVEYNYLTEEETWNIGS